MKQPYKETAVDLPWRQDDLVQDTWTATARPPQAASDWLLGTEKRPQCAAPGCGAVGKFWKRSGRPVFDGQWACGRTCLTKLVETAIWREMAGMSVAQGHTHRIPLGLVMLAQESITQAQLHRALALQRAEGRGRIGEWLVSACNVDETNVTRALGVQWNCPVFTLASFDPRHMATVLPAPLRKVFGLLPLRLAHRRTLYLGAREAPDPVAALALERMAGLHVESGMMSEAEMRDGSLTLESHAAPTCLEARAKSSGELIETMASALMQAQPVASRLVRFHDFYWLRMWLEPAALSGVGTLPAAAEDVVDLLYRIGTTA